MHKNLLVLIILNIIATFGHYVDNICYFADYPEPHWLSPSIVDAFWFFMTPFAAFGYWYYLKGWHGLARWSLVAYCLMSLLVLGHYLIEPPWNVAFRINLLILIEALAAVVLLLYVLRLNRQVQLVQS